MEFLEDILKASRHRLHYLKGYARRALRILDNIKALGASRWLQVRQGRVEELNFVWKRREILNLCPAFREALRCNLGLKISTRLLTLFE